MQFRSGVGQAQKWTRNREGNQMEGDLSSCTLVHLMDVAFRPHYTDVETGLAPMFFYETQMPPEPLRVGNLSWNLSMFQARHLGQLLRAKWGGVHQVNFLLYKL
jgi:hypothetical protein